MLIARLEAEIEEDVVRVGAVGEIVFDPQVHIGVQEDVL